MAPRSLFSLPMLSCFLFCCFFFLPPVWDVPGAALILKNFSVQVSPLFSLSHTFWPRSDNSKVSALLGMLISSHIALSFSPWSRDPAAGLRVSQTKAFDLSSSGSFISVPATGSSVSSVHEGCLCVQPDRAPLEPRGRSRNCPCIKTAACFTVGCGMKD